MPSSVLKTFNQKRCTPLLQKTLEWAQTTKRKGELERVADRELHCFVPIGGQNSGKSTLLGRILNMPGLLPTAAKRCSRCFIEVTLFNDSKVSDYDVRIIHDKNTIFEKKMDLKRPSDCAEISTFLFDKQEELGANAENVGRAFFNERIQVQITSEHIECSFSVLDVPGLISNDVDALDDKAVEELARMITAMCKHRKTSYLLVHEATQTLDGSIALKFIKEKIDKTLSKTHVILTKCDRLQNDQMEQVIQLVENGAKQIPKNRTLCVSNRTNDDDKHDDHMEEEWFNQSALKSLPNHLLGSRNLRHLILTESTKVLMQDVFPKLKEILGPELLELQRTLKELEAELNNNSDDPFKIIGRIQKYLKVLYGPVRHYPDVKPEFLAMKRQITGMSEGKTDSMHSRMDDCLDRLVIQPSEEITEGENTKKEIIEMMALDKRIYDMRGLTDDPAGNIDMFLQLFNIICERLVDDIKKDQKRIEFLDDYLARIDEALTFIIDVNTKNMPEFRRFLTELFKKYRETMEEKFHNFCNNLVYDLFGQIVPYNMMVRAKTPEERLVLTHYIDHADGGKLKPTKDLDVAMEPIREHVVIYMTEFVHHVKMCTQSYMQAFALGDHVTKIDEELPKKFDDFKKREDYDEDKFKLDDKAEETKEKVEEIQKEIDQLADLKKEIDSAISEFRRLDIDN